MPVYKETLDEVTGMVHVKDVFVPYHDDDPPSGFEGEELFTWEHEYSSDEARLENERLHNKVRENKKLYEDGIASRLHRIIPLIPYMWT